MIPTTSHFGRLKLFAIALVCALLWAGPPPALAGPTPAPRSPQGSLTLPASAAQKTTGESWLSPTASGRQSLHLHNRASVRFDLSGLNLSPGYYRIGLVARTGTRWTDANGQIGNYRWKLITATDAGAPSEELTFAALTRPGFQPVRESGEPDSWANWYGTLQATRPCLLRGNEQIEIINRENHGGVIELWIQKAASLNAVEVGLQIDAPSRAFIRGNRPVVHLRLHLPDGLPPLDATLAVEWLDLLSGKSITTRSPLRLPPGKTENRTLSPDLKPGVYRIRAEVEPTEPSAPPAENPSSAQGLFAYAPARLAADLPDDWPLGAHVTPSIPPLPGFRWYRYFAQWPETHPAPGRYDWTAFDAVFSAVQKAGGRLLIASDGSPVWTSARGKAGMAWSPAATAYPPDDWNVLRDYLAAMLARYHDARGTLGALELCNEANTPDRWLGDTQQMLAHARVFADAAKSAKHPVKTIGLSVSAGDQRGYVTTLVDAGILQHVDAVSAHFYEELMSPESATPINNLPKHVAMLREPMQAAGSELPMINTECGIGFAPRINDRPPSQEELNATAHADPQFDPKQPWLLGAHWRPVSERRAAATYVGGIVQLMALGVKQSYVFSQLDLLIDGAPSLPWVALGCLGARLDGVDYRQIRPLAAHYPGGDDHDGSPQALAYLLGRPGGRQVIIAWGFLRDTSVGRSKHWQRWLDPLPVRIQLPATSGVLTDLYARTASTIRSTGDGFLEFPCGEEPVFIEINPH